MTRDQPRPGSFLKKREEPGNEVVSVYDYLQHFSGQFGGVNYDSDAPVPRVFKNSESCKQFAAFISSSICDRIEVGAVSVVGQVEECSPPTLVMPLTVEPNKPRLCQDQHYLNCWMKDMLFKLDSVVHLPQYVGKDHQSKLDDMSGYDHVLMHKDSRHLMGFQWGGWWFVNNVIPFSWKISPYVYQALGMVATQELHNQHIPCSQYIDDRHLGQRRVPQHDQLSEAREVVVPDSPSSCIHASQAVFIAIQVLTSLGYFFNLSKSVLVLVQQLIFLRLMCDSILLTFILPQDKIGKFAALQITMMYLQKLVGKCVLFSLVVPAAKLFTCKMNITVSRAMKS